MRKVLIVEDNELNVELLVQLLEDHFVLSVAADGEQAVALAAKEHPDLILMDMSLPGVDGWTALRRLKSDPVLCRIPVISVSAHAMEGDEAKARAAGSDDYITKPIDEVVLFRKLKVWLGS